MGGRWRSQRIKLNAQQKREQSLAEILKGVEDRRGKNSALYFLLSGSTQSMAGFSAQQIRRHTRDSLRVVRRSNFRVADSDIWHALASNIHALEGPEEARVLAQELSVDRQLVNFAVRETLRHCGNSHRLTPQLLEKINALRAYVSLPALLWEDRRLAEARAYAEKVGAL